MISDVVVSKRLIATFMAINIVAGSILGALRGLYQLPFFLGGWLLLYLLFDYTINRATGSERGFFGMSWRTIVLLMGSYLAAFLVAFSIAHRYA